MNAHLYHYLTSTSMDAYLLMNLTGNIIEVNAAATTMYGYSRDELLTLTIHDVEAVESDEETWRHIAKVMADGFDRFESRHYHKTGSIIEVEVSSSYVPESRLVLSFCRDITDRKRADEALRASHHQYQQLVDNARDGIFTLDTNGGFLFVNPAICTILGYSREELLRLNILDTYPDNAQADGQRRLALLGDGESIQFERTAKCKDGSLITIEANAWKTNDGSLQAFVRDTSRRKQAEEQISLSNRLLHSIINTAPIRVFWKDTNLVYMGCNHAFARDAGADSPNDVVGRDDYQLGWKEQAELYRADDRRTIESGIPKLSYEEPQTTPDGSRIWLRTSKVPLRNEAQEIIGVLGIYEDITTRKDIELQLRFSEENYRTFSGLTSDYVHRCSRTGTAPFRIQWMGGAVSSISGYTPEEILAKGCWLPLVHPDDRQAVAEYLFSFLPGDVKQIEFRLISKEGKIRWISEKANCVAGEHAGELVLFGASTDITEKRLTEEKLRETQELFSLFMQYTPVYTFIKQIEKNQSRVLQLSENFIEMLGRPAEELRGHTMDEMFPPDFAGKITADDIAVVMGGNVVQLDEEFNGRSYITIKFPMLREGKDALLAGYTIDVTERRKAEETIRLNEERAQVLMTLNQMTEASLQELTDFSLEEAVRVTKSTIGYLAFMNEDESVLTMHSWSKAAMAKCGIIDKPIEYPIEKTGLWGEAVRQRRPVITNDYGAPSPLKKGYPEGHVHVSRHMNIPVFAGNRIVLVAGVGNKTAEYDHTDVQQLTLLMEGMWRLLERKRAIEDRLELERQLLHAQKLESLGVLAGGIAHDFNNILTAIVGNTELALMQLPEESPVKDNLMRIEKAAVRATDLAKQMLAYSGRGKFVIETIDINRLIEEMGRMVEVSISKKVTLRYNLSSNLPKVNIDATQIRQVLMNLVINASEAIGESDGVVAISTGSVQCDSQYLKDMWRMDQLAGGRYVFLEVADTGCGMTREVIDKLFDPFFTTKFTGRGLGMAAVLGIVRGHHGAIKVQSDVGAGTTFQILLPASGSPGEVSLPEESVDAWHGDGTVLLVDDEETVRDIGREMLKNLGYEVVTAANGVEALDIIAVRQDINLVILDLTMPQMDGMQCFKALRPLKPELKVIMSSGFNEQEVTKQIEHEGLAGFIQKPYRLADLKAVLAQI